MIQIPCEIGRESERKREREREEVPEYRGQRVWSHPNGANTTKKEKQREREDEKRCHAMKRRGEKMKKRNHQNTRLTHS